MKIVTYATHAEGTFNELVKNPYGIEVVVLGWGTKWQGFIHRIKIYREYLDTLFDNEIVVFVDGFDSYILKPLDDLEDQFKYFNCTILVSEDLKIIPYYVKKVFKTCKDNITANAGLYMGYSYALKQLLDEILKQESSDDQINLNTVCKKFPNLKIDVDRLIFDNRTQFQNFKNSHAYFGQTPGGISFNRLTKHVHVFIPEILFVLFLIVYFLLKK